LDTRIYAAEQTAVSAHEKATDRLILLLSGNANGHFKLNTNSSPPPTISYSMRTQTLSLEYH